MLYLTLHRTVSYDWPTVFVLHHGLSFDWPTVFVLHHGLSFDWPTVCVLHHVIPCAVQAVRSVSPSHTDQMFVSGSDDNTLKVWDLATATAVTFSGVPNVLVLPSR